MEQSEVEKHLRLALVKMHVYERPHNKISFCHTKEGLEKIFQLAPVDEKDLKHMLKISLGISMRYVEEYLAGFRAYGIIWRENGTVYIEKPISEIPSMDVDTSRTKRETKTESIEEEDEQDAKGRNTGARILCPGKI